MGSTVGVGRGQGMLLLCCWYSMAMLGTRLGDGVMGSGEKECKLYISKRIVTAEGSIQLIQKEPGLCGEKMVIMDHGQMGWWWGGRIGRNNFIPMWKLVS